MTHRIVGRCSTCGGNVGVPSIWYGVEPPIPTCLHCGATAVNNLPVIQTRPNPRREPGTLGEYLDDDYWVGDGRERLSERDDFLRKFGTWMNNPKGRPW